MATLTGNMCSSRELLRMCRSHHCKSHLLYNPQVLNYKTENNSSQHSPQPSLHGIQKTGLQTTDWICTFPRLGPHQ